MKKQFLVVRYPTESAVNVLPENNAVLDNFGAALQILNYMLTAEGHPNVYPYPHKETPMKIEHKGETFEVIIIDRIAA